MIGEFELPEEIVDRKVTKMKMISPSNREVDVGRTLSETEYIGMCRREVLDNFLRQRASKAGANIINGLFMRLEQVLRACMCKRCGALAWMTNPAHRLFRTVSSCLHCSAAAGKPLQAFCSSAGACFRPLGLKGQQACKACTQQLSRLHAALCGLLLTCGSPRAERGGGPVHDALQRLPGGQQGGQA